MAKTAKKTVRKNASKKALASRGLLIRFDLGTDTRLLPKDWEDVIKHFKGKCVYCGKKADKLSKDHAIPVNEQHLGLHRIGNVVPACRKCNSDKGARHYVHFCRRQDKYGKIAQRGKEAELDITKYMKDMSYKKLGRNQTERNKIRKIISKAREQAAIIRDEAVASIEKIVNKKQKRKPLFEK